MKTPANAAADTAHTTTKMISVDAEAEELLSPDSGAGADGVSSFLDAADSLAAGEGGGGGGVPFPFSGAGGGGTSGASGGGELASGGLCC